MTDGTAPPAPRSLLTKAGRSESIQRPSLDRIDSQVMDQAVHRLQIVCLVLLAAQLGIWLTVNVVLGTLASEFASVAQGGPPIAVLVTSVVVLWLARSGRLPAATLVRVGLVYEVIVSFGIASGSYFGAFTGMTAADFNFDRVGLSYVAIWMMMFSVLVPARPREALLALIGSAASVPIVYLVQVPAGAAPPLPPDTFFLIFILPYAAATAGTYVVARVVHRMGVAVRRAHEMGSYRLVDRLGEGGMGEVWRATHHTLARPAAIKLIRSDALGSNVEDARLATKRFEREAQVIASLQSPHTVDLYDFGTTEDGTLFYVMELLEGVDLERLVRQDGPLPAARVIHILGQACSSLAEAHRRGIVHRDVKPANVYLCQYALECDVVKILDFGLAKPVSKLARVPEGPETRADLIVGTPSYLAPELALGHVADGRADLYALGCVAFWLLTGRLAFDGATPGATIVAHVNAERPRPSAFAEEPVPAALDELVLDCLAKDPDARPATADVLADRLRDLRAANEWTQDEAARWWRARGKTVSPSPVV